MHIRRIEPEYPAGQGAAYQQFALARQLAAISFLHWVAEQPATVALADEIEATVSVLWQLAGLAGVP